MGHKNSTVRVGPLKEGPDPSISILTQSCISSIWDWRSEKHLICGLSFVLLFYFSRYGYDTGGVNPGPSARSTFCRKDSHPDRGLLVRSTFFPNDGEDQG